MCPAHAQMFYTAMVRIGSGLAELNRAAPPGLTLWERPLVLDDDDPALGPLPECARPPTGLAYVFDGSETLEAYVTRLETTVVREAMTRTDGNATQAAKLVGAPYLVSFLRTLQRLGLKARSRPPPDSGVA